MSSKILLWGAPVFCDSNVSYTVSFEQSGENFGNILIGNAVQTFLAENELFFREEICSPEEAQEKCQHIVIPAANFLWKNFDFKYMYDFLEKTTLPITMIGVGAQANDRSIASQIHPNTLRLMKLVSERSASIGVRGYYTAEVLAVHGIHNIDVIGCPSFYTSRCPTIHIKKENAEPIRLAVNFSRRVSSHSFHPDRMRMIENEVLKLAIEKNASFIAQDEIDEIAISYNISNSVNEEQITNYFNTIDRESCLSFFHNHTKFFCNYTDWSKFIRKHNFSVGTRLHGNIMALINGIPALTIAHDSRTYEICALFNNPIIHVSSLDINKITIDLLKEAISESSFESFERSYALLYRRFVQFLNKNGLPHNLMQAHP